MNTRDWNIPNKLNRGNTFFLNLLIAILKQHGIAAMALLTKQLIINPTEYMSRADFDATSKGDQMNKQFLTNSSTNIKNKEATASAQMMNVEKSAILNNSVVNLPSVSTINTENQASNDYIVTHL